MRKTLGVAVALVAILLGTANVDAGERTLIQARTGTTTVGQQCVTGGTPTGPTLGTSNLSWSARNGRFRTSVTITLNSATPNTTYDLMLAQYVTEQEACWFGSAGQGTTDSAGDLRLRYTSNSYVVGQYRIEVWLVPPSGDPLFAGGIDTPTPA